MSSKNIQVDSCGLFNFSKEHMHKYSEEYLKSIGLPYQHKTKEISEAIVDESNLIYCFDDEILAGIITKFPHATAKTYKLIDEKNIFDPISAGEKKYFKTMEEINQACSLIADKLNSIY